MITSLINRKEELEGNPDVTFFLNRDNYTIEVEFRYGEELALKRVYSLIKLENMKIDKDGFVDLVIPSINQQLESYIEQQK